MRKCLLAIMAVVLPACAWAADLDVRHYYITNDVSAAVQYVAPLRWWQGESVKVDLWIRRGTTPVDLTGVTSAKLEVNLATNTTQLYMSQTGSVMSATNGYVSFQITPTVANLPTNNQYEAQVRLYQSSTLVGIGYSAKLQVLYSPNSTNSVWSGPYTNSVESDPVYTANGISAATAASTYLPLAGGTMSGDLNMTTLVGPPGSVNIGVGRGQVTNVAGISSPGGYQQLYWSDDVFRIMPYHSAYGSGSGPALQVDASGILTYLPVNFGGLDATNLHAIGGSGEYWLNSNRQFLNVNGAVSASFPDAFRLYDPLTGTLMLLANGGLQLTTNIVMGAGAQINGADYNNTTWDSAAVNATNAVQTNDARRLTFWNAQVATNYLYYLNTTNYVYMNADAIAYYFVRMSNGVSNIKTNSLYP